MAQAMLESITGKGGPLSRRLRNGLNSDDAAKAMMGRMVEMLSVPQSAQKLGKFERRAYLKMSACPFMECCIAADFKTGLTKQVNQMAADIKSLENVILKRLEKRAKFKHLYSEGDKDTGDGIQTRGLKALNKRRKMPF